MVDISVDRQPRKAPNYTLVLALALAFVLYDTRYWERWISPNPAVKGDLAQVLFVATDTMSVAQRRVADSQLVDIATDRLGVNRRRLDSDTEIGADAEPWLTEMFELGVGQAPCLVFRNSDGKLDIIPMPDTVDEAIEEIESRE